MHPAPSGRRRPVRLVAIVSAALLAGACAANGAGSAHPGASSPTSASGAVASDAVATGAVGTDATTEVATTDAGPIPSLDPASPIAPGSDPSVLPGPVLIADEGNDRLVEVDPRGRTIWEFPRPGDLAPGVEFKAPDDAFFTPDGKQIIATEEEFSVVTLIDPATHRILWRYGTPGHPGNGPNELSNPDDAIMLPDGHVLVADIKNCRLLLTNPGSQVPVRVYGGGSCRHRPPARFGSPNGAFPMANGHYLVTEINGDWVDEMDLNGKVYFSTHPPKVLYPSDSNEVSPGVYLTADFSKPGQLVTFDAKGNELWRYRPEGTQGLNHPSIALPLPNGDVIATDDHNHRIIVVDPTTNQVVWQYGVRGHPGTAPGFLNGVDGLDLAPPYSDLVRHASTMGVPTP